MIGKKEPVRVADVATVFAPADEVELPLTPEQRKAGATTGDIAPVRTLDGLGYQLSQLIDADPDQYGGRIWELTQMCLPTVSEERVLALTPGECGVIVLVATGRIKEVQALAETMSGNAAAPTMAEPALPRSQTPSDSSVPASQETAAAV